MQLECSDMNQMLFIEIRRVTGLSSKFLGNAGFFPDIFRTESGDFEGVIALNFYGIPVGDLYVKTSYNPDAMQRFP